MRCTTRTAPGISTCRQRRRGCGKRSTAAAPPPNKRNVPEYRYRVSVEPPRVPMLASLASSAAVGTMRNLLRGILVCLAVVPLTLTRSTPVRAVPLHVDFKLTDEEYRPLAGVPVR